MNQSVPGGVTPPTPGADKEEPDLWQEDDIPSDDRGGQARDGGRDQPGRGSGTAERQTDTPRE
jgi:hypothetical protein